MKIILEQAAYQDRAGFISNLPTVVELNTIEELYEIINKYQEDIIVRLVNTKGFYDKPTITIYNDYIE